MRILLVHNHYLQRGGEDAVFEAEAALLGRHGHRVHRLEWSNEHLANAPWMAKARTALASTWSIASYREVRENIRQFRPDLVHCHNTFPIPSPSVFNAARAESKPVIQTLHNYRLLCLNGLMFRDGSVCRDCLGRSVLSGIIHSCYRDSLPGSVAVAGMLTLHRQWRTWNEMVDRYIALTEHSRNQFVAGGLPPERISVKPNFVHPDPGEGRHSGGFALYVGRLSEEKGIRLLLKAWKGLGAEPPLRICGDGPLRGVVEEACRSITGLSYEGYLPTERVIQIMRDASFLVMPSIWDEHAPLALLQGFATGLPAVVSDQGALAELVELAAAGWTVPRGDADALALAAREAWEDVDQRRAKGRAARDEFLRRYSAKENVRLLTQIYRGVLEARGISVQADLVDDGELGGRRGGSEDRVEQLQ